jgi:hypothetical protein
MTTTRTPASVRRNPANGAPRFTVEVRTESGWRFLDARTTKPAAVTALDDNAEHPKREAYRGLPLRVRDTIDGVTVLARG